jgi:hypothetical protein
VVLVDFWTLTCIARSTAIHRIDGNGIIRDSPAKPIHTQASIDWRYASIGRPTSRNNRFLERRPRVHIILKPVEGRR